ncbi:deoxyhypusine hydroxylase [Salpingoeca rosetta]|uniref:Deoxyhypusine hydroxylase n=1 Tax=Salpingoeca rosetta (strain ATCC 50818 / BSB-021) TaxID=946362 RepID=F2UQA9_SALR5|nr:deoxyhypusine hydroxylase [Salpingoeca rosetta]EGD79777.1 deoxyhypusine hydroxylase [Salpingoeca rosetta]|eukprot:XP_004988726.1 deoxyhypusine hydroxylase [Salpingoeca rosetta]
MSPEEQANLIEAEGKILVDVKAPLKDRFRALFALRNLGGQRSIELINQCFEDESALLKHECAYCLGQMQDDVALPYLSKVLEDEQQDVMVRHEAAEALGAIGNPASLDLLLEYTDAPQPEISETCQIAADRIRFQQQKNEAPTADAKFLSVDPAPAAPEDTPIPDLRATLLDTSKPLFERYRALFALRNIGSEDAVKAIVDGFQDKSALFRHELGYVLGQLQHPAAIEGLKARLEDGAENYMVRHECAEALGSIAHDKCLPVLKAFAGDSSRVVRESCIVALDMHEHETSGEFQYASAAK